MRSEIDIKKFSSKAVDLWLNRWMLLTSGDKETFNTMTVAWGSIGGMWHKPFVQVVVRPQRYTYAFMEKYDTFTLSSFPAEYKKALGILGSKSGRDGDKIGEAGLTPVSAAKVEAPTFEEADLVIECRKIYWQDMDPKKFLLPEIHDAYSDDDYHRIYFGEILRVEGSSDFCCSSDS